MRLPALALGCALTLAVAGCSGGHTARKTNTSIPPTTAPATGMFQGKLETAGGPAPGNPRPIPGTVTFQGPDGSIAKAPVGRSGKFAIGLAPGSYLIQGTSPMLNDGKYPCTAGAKVTLKAGKTVTVNVVCSVP